MGDDFTSPDPAGTQDTDMASQAIVVGEDVRCENCEHFDVCAYYAGVKPLLEDPQTGMGEAPFEAGMLAAICDFFEPVDAD